MRMLGDEFSLNLERHNQLEMFERLGETKRPQTRWTDVSLLLLFCPGYDVRLIRCCPQYDVKLMWRHRGNDIVSVAAICAAAQLIFLFGRTRLAV